MAAMLVLHDRLPGALVLFAGVSAVWGAWAGWRGQPVSSRYWSTLIVGEALALVQGLAGWAMLGAGRQPERMVHGLYGALAVLAWPAAWAGARRAGARPGALAYSLASLLVLGCAVRAIATA